MNRCDGRTAAVRLKDDWLRYWRGLLTAGIVLLLLQLLFGTVCPARLLAGLPCPACGMTRALCAFFAGQWGEAWAWNPLFPAVPAGAVLFAVTRYVKPAYFRVFTVYLYTFIAALTILYIYRMATLFPHTAPLLFYGDDILAVRLIAFLKSVQNLFT